jgi:transcriptional regulator with XRE-family HTH domain
MAITNELLFKKPHLVKFSRLFRAARLQQGLTQLQVANKAFEYAISHCKVSRIERCAMPKVDAYAISRMAKVLGVSNAALKRIDPKFKARLTVAVTASDKGFWPYVALGPEFSPRNT